MTGIPRSYGATPHAICLPQDIQARLVTNMPKRVPPWPLINGHVGASQRPVYSAVLIFSQNLSLALSKHSGSQPEHHSSTEHFQCTLRPVHAGEEIRECLLRSIDASALLRRLRRKGLERKVTHENRNLAKTLKRRPTKHGNEKVE